MFYCLLMRYYWATIIVMTLMFIPINSFPQMIPGGPGPVVPGTAIGNSWNGLNARSQNPGWSYGYLPPYGLGDGWNRWGNTWNNAYYNALSQRYGLFYPWNAGCGWRGVGY